MNHNLRARNRGVNRILDTVAYRGRMQQLSGLDAAFLSLDSPTSTGHVGGVHLIEATGADGESRLTLERLTALILSLIHI